MENKIWRQGPCIMEWNQPPSIRVWDSISGAERISDRLNNKNVWIDAGVDFSIGRLYKLWPDGFLSIEEHLWSLRGIFLI